MHLKLDRAKRDRFHLFYRFRLNVNSPLAFVRQPPLVNQPRIVKNDKCRFGLHPHESNLISLKNHTKHIEVPNYQVKDLTVQKQAKFPKNY